MEEYKAVYNQVLKWAMQTIHAVDTQKKSL